VCVRGQGSRGERKHAANQRRGCPADIRGRSRRHAAVGRDAAGEATDGERHDQIALGQIERGTNDRDVAVWAIAHQARERESLLADHALTVLAVAGTGVPPEVSASSMRLAIVSIVSA
jgi:hypothetical protein